MRIVTTPEKPIPASARAVADTGVPYIPTAGKVKDYGSEWMTGKDFEAANGLTGTKTKANSKKERTTAGKTTTSNKITRGGQGANISSGSDGGGALSDIEWAHERIQLQLRWNPEDPSGYFVQVPDSTVGETLG